MCGIKLSESEKKKVKRGRCRIMNCRKPRFPGKTLCPRCMKREHKKKNLLSYTYSQLKSRARRRKKEFSLTIVQFKKFCEETQYLIFKGSNPKSATIDRKDHTQGYHIDNIRVLSHQQNSLKGSYEKKGEECPF